MLDLPAIDADIAILAAHSTSARSFVPKNDTPSHDGLFYYEVFGSLDGLTRRGNSVDLDLVEVAPDYDQNGSTLRLDA